MIIKFGDFITESIRNKMIPKSDEELSSNIKNHLNIDNNIVSILIWNPYNYTLVSDDSGIKSEKYNNNYYKLTGDIIKIYTFVQEYTKGNEIDVIRYIKDNTFSE